MSAGGEEARITAYRDGPLLVRGPFRLEDQDGRPIETRRDTIALCRCGKSRIRPFCDGTHRLVGFRVPSNAEVGREPSVEVGREPSVVGRQARAPLAVMVSEARSDQRELRP